MGKLTYQVIFFVCLIIVVIFVINWIFSYSNPYKIEYKENLSQFSEEKNCFYNNIKIPNQKCVYTITKNIEDKPKYCQNSQIINSCTSPGNCGCPNSNYVCQPQGNCILD